MYNNIYSCVSVTVWRKGCTTSTHPHPTPPPPPPPSPHQPRLPTNMHTCIHTHYRKNKNSTNSITTRNKETELLSQQKSSHFINHSTQTKSVKLHKKLETFETVHFIHQSQLNQWLA